MWGLRWVAVALPLVSMLTGCLVREVSSPQPLPVLPPVYTEANRVTAPSSEAPVAANFKTKTQLKLQAAQHWAKIAEDAARSIAVPLRKAAKCESSFDPCKTIYVNPPANVTAFSRAFHNQLITTLVKSELLVAKTSKSDLTLDIDVQPILFSPNRPQYRYAGAATQLGPGVWALRDVVSVEPGNAGIEPPAADAAHWFRSEFASGQTPQFEILVTVSVGSKSRYLARATNAYYITDGDRHLYDQEICSLIRLCAPVAMPGVDGKPEEKPKPAATSQLTVTGDCPNEKQCPPGNGSIETTDKPKGKRK